ncbi:MAG: SpaA isopeptide-forming pilin-related protein [Hespellia sp.]|nr:SpaA isopeptide-forming pilin-related protein [Hespellia sp.]
MFKKRRGISGALALLISCSTIFNAASAVQAAEPSQPEIQAVTPESTKTIYEEKALYNEAATALPDLSAVIEQLEEDEIVIAEDLVIDAGAKFDITKDFSKFTYQNEKVKIQYKEAVNEKKDVYSPDKAGAYQAVYEVYPVRDANLAYRITRMVTVKEKEPETSSEQNQTSNKDDTESDDTEGEPAGQVSQEEESEKDVKPETDQKKDVAVEVPTEEENQESKKENETEAAEEQSDEDDAENGVFVSVVPYAMSMQRGTNVSLVQGETLAYPSNLGNYVTSYFYVNGKLAYCLESPKSSPPDADYVAEVLDTNENLQKVLYYGYGGPGDITNSYMPQLDNDTRYIFTHIAASYAYMGDAGFHGCSMEALQACGVIDYINHLFSLENPPTAALSMNSEYEEAYLKDDVQRTAAFKLTGDHRNYITLDIPAKVTYHNVTDDKTKTGGSIKIYGGTEFYFSAPKTVTGTWNTGQMTGQYGGQWKTLVLSTGNSSQDIGYGDFIEDKATSVKLSVKWMDIAKITLTKKDKNTNVNLAGAVFGVYKDEACTSLIAKMPKTDANGTSSVEVIKTQDTVYLKEITAPVGYHLNTTAYNVKLVAGGNTDKTATNMEQKGKIKILKKGQLLSGVEQGNPMNFVYQNASYEGAVYSIYAAEDIISQDKVTVIHKKGTLVDTVTTAADGNAVSKELYLGKYKIVETKAPADLTIGKTEAETTKEVELVYAGQEATLAQAQTEYQNERPKISVKSVKLSQNDNVTLFGATYGLYAGDDIVLNGKVIVAKDTLIQSVTSNKEGIAAFSADIPINHTYYVSEIEAPDKYYKSDEIYSFTYTYKNDTTYDYIFSHEFKNEEVRAEIHIKKIDKETHSFLNQGDATLVGAEYGLFAAQTIEHPNKKSGILYEKDELVAKGKISEDGTLDFKNLYLGKYYVKELTPAEGYLLDETQYPIDASYEGQDVKIVHRDVTVHEIVKKQAFQMIKVGSDGEQTEADLLEKAGFKIYLISSLKGVKEGTIKPDANGNYLPEQFRTYDFTEDTTALDYSEDSNGIPMPELFTDSKGYAVSRELAYGKYVVIESTVPANYNPIDPFIVNINEDSRKPQQWRVFIDYEFKAILKIYKIDGTSKVPVLHAGATFKIYDLEAEEYVTQYTHYPELVEHTEFTTSDQGYLMTLEALGAGHYRIEEIAAPEGYVKAEPTEFTLSSDSAYEVEAETGAIIIKMEYENQRQTGTLRLEKTGELLTGYGAEEKSMLRKFGEFLKLVEPEETKKDFSYLLGHVAGAEFAIYATEDILSPDYQCDENGNRLVLYQKGELVSTIITDESGKAQLEEMPLGSYRIVETVAGNGFVLNKEVQEFTLEYAGDEVEVVYHDSQYENKRQKVSLQITKLDSETKKPVSGAQFGLYAAEDILAADESVLVPADTQLEVVTSDENGLVQFTLDLPIAHYYVKEETPAPGYVLNEEIIDFDLQYTNQEEETLTASAELENDFTKVDISKVDIGGKDIIGAELMIKDADGKEIASWVSDGSAHRIDRLAPGEYILIETLAPEGYEIAEEVPFTVLETGEIQKVEMVDEYEKTGAISVQKVGDMLTGISTYDSDFGKINRMEYEKHSLPGVEFTIYDKEGNIADVITTSEEGLATSKELSLGKYVLKETKTPAGLAMNYKEYEVELTKGQENQVVDVSLDIENDVIDTEINVYKVGEMLNPQDGTFGYNKKPLEGIYFGIYTNEEIKNYKDESVLPKDSLIGVIKTNKEGKATLKAALVSGHYYYKELQTLDGYILDEEKHEFELTLANEPITVFDVNKENPALNKLMKAKVSLVKVDANDESKKLSGAEFELFTEDGQSIGTYATDSNGEINISDLGYGKYYLKEKKAPNGYQKLDDKIEFTMKGEDILITCRNHVIPKSTVPKLGFEDSTLNLAIAFIAVGITALGIGFYIYKKKKNKKHNKK